MRIDGDKLLKIVKGDLREYRAAKRKREDEVEAELIKVERRIAALKTKKK